MDFDAFISYRNKKGGFAMAQLLRDKLKDANIKCFVDTEELRTGVFGDQIEQVIKQVSYFVLILPPGGLNRCIFKNDWVRREILTAVENGKPVIPVWCDGFQWPKLLNGFLPEQIQQLQYLQSIVIYRQYLSAGISKLISYITGMFGNGFASNVATPRSIASDTAQFFNEEVIEYKNVTHVDMAFHAGSEWFRDSMMVDLRDYFVQNKVPLRVIVNTPESVSAVCAHMRQPSRNYDPFSSSISDWLSYAAAHPDTVNVRLLDVPLLRRSYIVRRDDGTGAANIKYYTYGNYRPSKDFRLCFDGNSREFNLYAEEFDYLWEHSTTP